MMDQLREASAFFEKLNTTPTIDDAWALYQAEVGQWGICNILYGFTSHVEPLTGRPELTLFSNYSVQWEEAYDRLGGHENDVNVHHCLNREDDLLWYDPEVMATLSPEEMSVELAALKTGVVNGITFPLRSGPDKKDWGGVGLGSRLNDADFAALLDERRDYLRLVSQIFHAVVLARPLAKNIALLTDKEKQALTMAGRGLKDAEIAERLNITGKAVTARIGGAMKKLESGNRTQAVAEAIRLHIVMSEH